MKKIDLYSTQTHGLCYTAKRLLRDKGVSYLEIYMSFDPMLGVEIKRKANGTRTIPKICINNAHLGAFADLYAIQQFGNFENY